MPGVEWGARKAILNDLSPAATFIAYNYNTPVDAVEFEKEAKRIIKEVEEECGWMYETQHAINGNVQYDIEGKPIKGKINYIVWSDVFVCPNCAHELVFWEVAVDKEKGKVKNEFQCDNCGTMVKKAGLERAITTVYDDSLKENIQIAKQVPVLINYLVGKKRYNKKPDNYDLQISDKINATKIPYWFPIDGIPEGYNTEQPKRSHGITHVHHFYDKKNLLILSEIYEKIITRKNKRLLIAFQSIAVTLCSKLARYNLGNRGNGPVTGTLYIASLVVEANVFKALKRKINDFKKSFFLLNNKKNNSRICCSSANSLKTIQDSSIDYIFTDPTFW
jgi:predicted RNA-binding Zn-ribbon protein involved in translation (DUF1610 family)